MNRHTVALNLLQIGEAEPPAVAIGTLPIGLMGSNLSLWMRRDLSALFAPLRFLLSKTDLLPAPVPARSF